MMLEENATVTMCHSHTQSLAYHTYGADIIVSAVGKPNTIQPNMVNCMAVVVDVGINRDENNKLCGDVDPSCAKKCDVTPVPKAYRDWETDRKSTRLNSSHSAKSRMPSSA